MSDELPDGIDAGEITAWLAARVEVAEPLSFSLITGGRSNLTYRVADAAGRTWVLRRPPLGSVLATAHDMSREHRIISALDGTDVPVPTLVGLSPDDSVNGAPFYVMDFVAGRVLHDQAEAEAVPVEVRTRAGRDLVDVLARIHAVDPDAVGLGDLGRRDGYIARQLKRWYGQWEKSKDGDVPAVDAVFAGLSAAIPDQGPATLVHGDYRLDNCLLTETGAVAAVLDWELCTLGDPLADVGLLLVYWADPEDTFTALPGGPTLAEGFPRRPDLLARYAAASGRDLGAIDFYVAFGYWKVACILQGVLARYRDGAMGSDTSAWQHFPAQVRNLAGAAETALERYSP